MVQLLHPHNELNQKVWNNTELREDVRIGLLKISDEFINYLKLSFEVDDITFTGSMANYNYTDKSDIDLHILVDFDKINNDHDLVKQYFDAKRRLWNLEHEIDVKGQEVELYVQHTLEPHHSSGVFSIKNNKWIHEPIKKEVNYDEETILLKVKDLTKRIDDAISGSNIEKELIKIKDKIGKMRADGLQREGETSTENIVFKLLRRNGYLQKLSNVIKNEYDKSLTIEKEGE